MKSKFLCVPVNGGKGSLGQPWYSASGVLFSISYSRVSQLKNKSPRLCYNPRVLSQRCSLESWFELVSQYLDKRTTKLGHKIRQ